MLATAEWTMNIKIRMETSHDVKFSDTLETLCPLLPES